MLKENEKKEFIFCYELVTFCYELVTFYQPNTAGYEKYF